MRPISNIVVLFLSIIILFSSAFAQQNTTDSLKIVLSNKLADTSRVLILDQLGFSLMSSKPLIAMQYAQEGLALAQKINYPKGIVRNLNRIGGICQVLGNNPEALKAFFDALQIAEEHNDLDGKVRVLNNIGVFYSEQKEFKKALETFFKAKDISKSIHNENLLRISLSNIGMNYAFLNQLDSAHFNTQLAYEMAVKQNSNNINVLLMNLGNIYKRSKELPSSLKYYRLSLPYSKVENDDIILSQTYLEMAEVFRDLKQTDSCLYYAEKSLKIAKASGNIKNVYESSTLLAEYYEGKDVAKSYQYFKLSVSAKGTLFNQEKTKEIQNLSFKEQMKEQELIASQKEFEAIQKQRMLLGIMGIIFLLAVILYRNNRQKQKANTLLQTQKEQIDAQKNKIEQAFSQLKDTQAQLVQQEKLASLGELTAGIAHEIQNPLNFVNNFSELSIELIEEAPLPPEGEYDENWLPKEAPPGGWGAFFADLTQNLEKINHHGKRASNIVKAMLEHSRASSGIKELTDINMLADEYLRLSYHGMKAKAQKDSLHRFDADYELIIDPSLPKIKVIPQDIGRVLLNLINNAFQSQTPRGVPSEGGLKKTLKVVVSTKFLAPPSGAGGAGGWVAVSVSDNGAGIPKEILNKIFQPFFTTKAPGEGTGLGLSLSYDIITKGHNGTIEVESKESEGTTFTIKLPFEANKLD